jgi:hypothetical protein
LTSKKNNVQSEKVGEVGKVGKVGKLFLILKIKK